MLAQCWLHIGIEKTGTTSIQNYLAANRSRLLSQGRLYPVTPGRFGHLDLVAFALDDRRVGNMWKMRGLTHSEQIAAFRDKFVDALTREIAASGASEIILSSELLSSRLRNHSELKRIKTLCDGIARKTIIVVYLRNQVDFLVSRYTTVIHMGGREEFRLHGTSLGNYARLLDRWARVFGRQNLVVRRFEPGDFVGGDLLTDFAASIGLDSRKLVAVPRQNESLDAESLAFLRAFNRTLPRWLSERIGPLRAASVTILQRRPGGTRFVISPSMAERIESRYRASNERVAVKYFGGTFQPLFSAPVLVGHAANPKPPSFSPILRIAGFLTIGLIRHGLARGFSRKAHD